MWFVCLDFYSHHWPGLTLQFHFSPGEGAVHQEKVQPDKELCQGSRVVCAFGCRGCVCVCVFCEVEPEVRYQREVTMGAD